MSLPQGSLGIAESVQRDWASKGQFQSPGYAVLAPPRSSCFQILTQLGEFGEEAHAFSAHTHGTGKGMGWGVGFLSFVHLSVRENLCQPQRAHSLPWVLRPPSSPR